MSFAREYPKIAGRLGLEDIECTDPYVERLLEGFAFLTARVQLKIDAEFPRFTQHFLECVYPHYLAPTPSMVMVQLQPDLSEGALAEGPEVPRHTVLRSVLGKGEQTASEYRTAHSVKLWPIELTDVEYLPTAAAVQALGLPGQASLKAGLRIRLQAAGDVIFSALPIDELVLYLRGSDALPMQLYEQLLGHRLGLVVVPVQRPPRWQQPIKPEREAPIQAYGFAKEQALLPFTARSFDGYRLLQEYFAFPERYLFIKLAGLRQGLSRCNDQMVDLVILLDNSEPALEDHLHKDNLALFCSPAINLFPKRADRIHLNDRQFEYHILPDRTRPLDFEVYSVSEVTGYGTNAEQEQTFAPFYASRDRITDTRSQAYYTLHRTPRQLSSKQRRQGARSSYIGSEVYIALVDGKEAPYRSELRQLGINTLCTNRDLPLHMPLGQGKTDFTIESGLPIAGVRCLSAPTKPRPAIAERDVAWRLISHLQLNYLSLLDNDERRGAAALRELLSLYCDANNVSQRKQIEEGLRSISHQAVTRRLPIAGPIAFGRGLQITVHFDELAFEGSGVFLLGAVLEQFFAKYASINHFTETIITTENRGEIMRWPVRSGLSQVL